jgi:uncharacterized PurR-regulated membrane protein YhhQ (DUF165 family)
MNLSARHVVGVVALACYVTLIVLANWAIARFGFVPSWPGLVCPAGTYFAGAVFLARDMIQITFGRWWVLPAIAFGALLSFQVSPSFAAASAAAFGLGELADWAVFTPLVGRGKIIAAFVLANTVGLFVDTLVFLQLAFGSTTHWQGTVVGKAWLVLPVFLLRLGGRKVMARWAAT